MRFQVVLLTIVLVLTSLACKSYGENEGEHFKREVLIIPNPDGVVTSHIRYPKVGHCKKIKSFTITDLKHGIGHNLVSKKGGVGFDYVEAKIQSDFGKGLHFKYTVVCCS